LSRYCTPPPTFSTGTPCSWGQRTFAPDAPTEKVDTKILETLVELDPGAQLPDGLRVDASIVPEGGEVAELQPARF